jgi:hypothetical protein
MYIVPKEANLTIYQPRDKALWSASHIGANKEPAYSKHYRDENPILAGFQGKSGGRIPGSKLLLARNTQSGNPAIIEFRPFATPHLMMSQPEQSRRSVALRPYLSVGLPKNRR